MMRQFRVAHPTDSQKHALYGWDHAVGFFVQIRDGRRVIASYDSLNPGYDEARPLEGALLCLADAGFFSRDDIAEAFVRGMDQLPEEMPETACRVAEVIRNFRRAAD